VEAGLGLLGTADELRPALEETRAEIRSRRQAASLGGSESDCAAGPDLSAM
jgi:hypothetical protein